MKKLFFIATVIVLHSVAFAQCYEPNIRKADAEYAKGNYSTAYKHYKNASQCPDAKRFENGKQAKAGMQKCYPILRIDGQKDLSITVGREAGERTFKVTSSRLDSEGWKIGSNENCEVVSVDYHNNTITVKWGENRFVMNKSVTFYIRGYGVDYVSASVEITQQGWPDETVSLPQGARYDSIIKGANGISFVLYHGKYGFIDSTGVPITPLKYTYVEKSRSIHGETETYWGKNDMLMRVFSHEKYGFIDCNGREVIPLIYDYIAKKTLKYGFSSTVVKKGDKFGLLNGAGEEVVPCIYDDFIGGHLDEPVAFEKNDKYAFFGYNGKKLTEFRYDYVNRRYSNSDELFSGYSRMCLVRGKNGKLGFVNINGEEIVAPQYEHAYHFEGNRAFVSNGKKFGVIDSKGNLVIPYKYESGGYYVDDVGLVRDGNDYMFIDSMGNILSDNKYKKLLFWSSGGGYYCMSKTGKDTVYVYYGIHESKNYIWKNEDTTNMKQAAQLGINAAKMDMAYYYYRHGSKERSLLWAIAAAHGCNSKSKTYLANKYYYGKGCPKNYNEAYRWFLMAANEYDGEAMAYLGWMLWHGQGCTQNQQEAIEWERKALLAGYDEAYDFMKKAGMNTSGIKPYKKLK